MKNEIKIAKKNKQLDKRFIFYNSGFNLRPTDVSASIGLSQFKDLNKFIKIRKFNRNLILDEIKDNKLVHENLFITKENKFVNASWFGIPIILSKKIQRKKFIREVEKNGIETRPIISGNFLKQPSIKKYKLHKNLKLKNSDHINDHGFFIGLPTKKMTQKNAERLVKILEKSI